MAVFNGACSTCMLNGGHFLFGQYHKCACYMVVASYVGGTTACVTKADATKACATKASVTKAGATNAGATKAATKAGAT